MPVSCLQTCHTNKYPSDLTCMQYAQHKRSHVGGEESCALAAWDRSRRKGVLPVRAREQVAQGAHQPVLMFSLDAAQDDVELLLHVRRAVGDLQNLHVCTNAPVSSTSSGREVTRHLPTIPSRVCMTKKSCQTCGCSISCARIHPIEEVCAPDGPWRWRWRRMTELMPGCPAENSCQWRRKAQG